MSPPPSILLGLVLCLGQMIRAQEGSLPKPSLRAEPGLLIPRGRPVTLVCRGPARTLLFRLEKVGSQKILDEKCESQGGSQGTEARFHIPVVSEDTAGCYRCLYQQGSEWSNRSEALQLQVTEEDVSAPPSGAPRVFSSTLSSTPSSTPSSAHSSIPVTHTKPHSSAGLSSKYVYILVGTTVAFLLCLLLLVLLLVRRQKALRRKHESPHSKGEEQRPPERLSPAADITESTPNEATDYALPEEKREMQSPSFAAGDAQEVTYAQLDQRALTLRAAQVVSPPPAEPTAAASTYAELPRR